MDLVCLICVEWCDVMCECLFGVVCVIFVEKGYVAVSVEDIVVVVGYMCGVFYLNFGGKVDVLFELLCCDWDEVVVVLWWIVGLFDLVDDV